MSGPKTTWNTCNAIAVVAWGELVRRGINPTAGDLEEMTHWIHAHFDGRIAVSPAPSRMQSAWHLIRAAWRVALGVKP
jgi:hypothetical protein